MKKMILAMAILMTVAINAITYLPVGQVEATEEKKSHDYSIELFVVESKADDGFVNAISIEEDTKVPNGYILEDKYKVGDLVEVIYNNDDIMAERKITGEELDKVEEDKGAVINAVIEKSMEKDYITTEDGSHVHKSYYQ